MKSRLRKLGVGVTSPTLSVASKLPRIAPHIPLLDFSWNNEFGLLYNYNDGIARYMSLFPKEMNSMKGFIRRLRKRRQKKPPTPLLLVILSQVRHMPKNSLSILVVVPR
jgi:hypothetical protein